MLKELVRSEKKAELFIMLGDSYTLFISNKESASRFSNLFKNVAVDIIVKVSNNACSLWIRAYNGCNIEEKVEKN